MAIALGTAPAGVLQAGLAQPAPFPSLRQELELLPGPHNADGSPSWMLHDPSANRFFRLGWMEFEILNRWQLGSADAIVGAFNESSVLVPTLDDVQAVSEFLMTHNLVRARGGAALERLNKIARKQSKRSLGWMLKNYLFLRIPLVRPDRFLDASIPFVSWMGSRAFAWFTLACGLLGLVMVSRQLDVFFSTFSHFFSLSGILMAGFAIGFAKIIHEMSHAYVSKYYGCRVPSMGLALLVLWPVLYTDATDAWKLRERAQRLRIGGAGMLAEIYLAAYATLLWSFLPEGAFKSAVFLLATTTWLMTLLINLNPFLRFDGYYLFSDYLSIPNLQTRAFEFARWRLRESLFGYGMPEPEFFPPRIRNALYFYAYFTWIYRFFLFLGIAVIVYHFFFKALGIFLMVVELAWFIGRPVFLEISEWVKRRHLLRPNLNTLRTVLLVLVLALVLFYPWASTVNAPGYWRAQQHVRIYVPIAAQIAEVPVRVGDRVNSDQLLLAFKAPDMEHEVAQHARTVEILRWQSEFRSVSAQLQARATVLGSALEAELASYQARELELSRTRVRSPLEGEVAEMLQPLAVGDWLAEGDWLMTVIAPDAGMIEVWVGESDIARLRLDQPARFYPAAGQGAPFDLRIIEVAETATHEFSEPYMASLFGGPVATRESADGRWVADISVYRVLLQPDLNQPAPSRITTGSARLPVEPQSLITAVWRKAAGVFIRESGF